MGVTTHRAAWTADQRRGNRMAGVEPRVVRIVDAAAPSKADDPATTSGAG